MRELISEGPTPYLLYSREIAARDETRARASTESPPLAPWPPPLGPSQTLDSATGPGPGDLRLSTAPENAFLFNRLPHSFVWRVVFKQYTILNDEFLAQLPTYLHIGIYTVNTSPVSTSSSIWNSPPLSINFAAWYVSKKKNLPLRTKI